MAKIKLNIKAEFEERWLDDFCSMLKWMESCGNIGHSSLVAFYSDGDGDFRPKFKFNKEFKIKEPCQKNCLIKIEHIYDAG